MTDLGVADPGRPLSRIPQLLNPWLTLAGGTVGVLGLLWAAVQYLNPLRPVDVTVVSQDAVEFRLPAGAGALQKLALTYDGRAVDKVAIVPVTIINSGRQPIQAPQDGTAKEWVLMLRSRNQTPIERVGDLVRTPRYVQAETSAGPTPDVVQVKVGLLNAGESIALQVAFIGGGNKFSIEAEESGPRIPNLRLVTAVDSVRNRIQQAFLPPLWLVCVLALTASWVFEAKKRPRPIGPMSWRLAFDALAAVLLVAFAAGMAAGGLSWLISWIVYLVAFR
jgi:hypothetical protein